jgi:hypothetical protein
MTCTLIIEPFHCLLLQPTVFAMSNKILGSILLCFSNSLSTFKITSRKKDKEMRTTFYFRPKVALSYLVFDPVIFLKFVPNYITSFSNN